jgi:hypothetical protein
MIFWVCDEILFRAKKDLDATSPFAPELEIHRYIFSDSTHEILALVF